MTLMQYFNLKDERENDQWHWIARTSLIDHHSFEGYTARSASLDIQYEGLLLISLV